MLSHYERYEPRSTQKHPIRIRISQLKNIYRAASYITWIHSKIVKAVINRDHIPSLVILSENISTKHHHQTCRLIYKQPVEKATAKMKFSRVAVCPSHLHERTNNYHYNSLPTLQLGLSQSLISCNPQYEHSYITLSLFVHTNYGVLSVSSLFSSWTYNLQRDDTSRTSYLL